MKLDQIHVMLDLETMSSNNNAAIISIGAVKFSVERGIVDEFYMNVQLESSYKAGLEIDPNTVLWWLKQSDAARAALDNHPVLLKPALESFSFWYLKTEDGKSGKGILPVWGNGATFDNVVISSAYKAVKVKRPWSFKLDHCYRTMKNLYSDVPFPIREGTHHNALDDAKYQALHLIEIFKRMQ